MKPIRIAMLALVGLAVVALAGVGRPESAGGAAQEPRAGITVTGLGTIRATPDEATFSLGVQSDGRTARDALSANSTRMERVLAALGETGVRKADVKTQDVSVSPRYTEKGPSGYTARNTVEVRIRDLENAGAVLDAATTAGANEVYGPSLDRSDRDDLQAKALRSAVENARKKAEALAGAAGVRVGRVTAIEEGLDGGQVMPYAADMRMSAEAKTPIEPGAEDIQATVTVTFAIE